MGRLTRHKKRTSESNCWESDDDLKKWVQKVPKDDKHVLCKFCQKKVKANKTSLAAHATSDAHRKTEAEAYFDDTGDIFSNENKKLVRGKRKPTDSTFEVCKELVPVIKAPKKTVKKNQIPPLSVWPKVILFGDSLTQFSFSDGGWGAMLANKLQRRCDVVNRGFSGYNSRWGTIILPRLFPSNLVTSNVAVFVIFLGANDSNIEELNPQQSVPAVEYGENINAMIVHLHSIGIEKKKIIVVGPPACDTLSWESACQARGCSCLHLKLNFTSLKIPLRLPMAKDNELVSVYNHHCEQTCKKCNIQFLDVYTAMMEKENWPSYLDDGLHLSKEGSKFMFDLLYPRIELLTKDLPQILPEWRTVDNYNPAAALLH